MSPPPSRLGKYDIVRPLGAGAMGVVYEAVDSVIERTVAIKTIRRGDLDADESAEHARRFLIEAKAAGKLNHPNIIGLYDHGNEAGLAYIVMERVQGRELQHWFDDGHRFGLEEALPLMRELLDALGYSHRRGVIHRDVKPANIFITDDGHIKLGDFGIARIESTQKTRIGSALGTPTHMAPEQIRGEAADARSDLYAAGVVLFQLLTGQKPFPGTMLSMALKVLNEPAPAPSSLRPGISPQLDAVVAKALAKQAAHRYQDAAAFWQALAAAGGVEAVGFSASGFGASGFGASGFGTSGLGASGLGANDAAQRSATGTGPTAVRPDQRSGSRLAPLWVGVGAAAAVVAAALWWTLRAPKSGPLPQAPPAADAMDKAPSIAVPSPSTTTARSAPMDSAPAASAASAEKLPAAPASAPVTAAAPSPSPTPTPTLSPKPAPTPAPKLAVRTPVREAPPPASPRTANNTPATVTPQAPRPARCSDILQKASLEPLTGEEAAYLRRECQ